MKSDPLADCAICGKPYIRRNSLQSVCGVRCATKVATTAKKSRQEADKAQRRALAKRRESLKPRSQWLREAQASVNAYVRERDKDLACISCGRWHDGQWHAGHYLSTGARPELRFNLLNIHKQCSVCNNHMHGNLVLYRAALVAKIGLSEVEKLEGPHEPQKYTVEELRDIRDTYRAKLREMRK